MTLKVAQHSSFHHKQQNEKMTIVTVALTCFQASILKLAKTEEHRLRLFLIYLYLQLIQNYSHNVFHELGSEFLKRMSYLMHNQGPVCYPNQCYLPSKSL